MTHDNGIGQTWEDCVPLYTWNREQAMKACQASGAVACVDSTRCGVLSIHGWHDADLTDSVAEWGYSDFALGKVSPDYSLCSPSGLGSWR